MAVLPKVRSALCAASQLPGEGPATVEDAPTPACLSIPDDDDDDYPSVLTYVLGAQKNPQHMFWLRNDKDIFLVRILN